jgi:hypothetical protein
MKSNRTITKRPYLIKSYPFAAKNKNIKDQAQQTLPLEKIYLKNTMMP